LEPPAAAGTQKNTDKEREENLKKAMIADALPGQGDANAGVHCHVILKFLAFSSSVFICVHLWFQRVSPCA
jgi:hypothetical protein